MSEPAVDGQTAMSAVPVAMFMNLRKEIASIKFLRNAFY